MKTIETNVNMLDAPLDVWLQIIQQKVGDDPVFFCDLTDIARKYINWTRLMPRVVPFYAVKCDASPRGLRLLAALGTGFDCSSQGEIKMVTDIGVPASKIVFANPTKQESHIRSAIADGVEIMTFDGAHELYKIRDIAPTAKLILRFRCDAKSANRILGTKFGSDADLEGPNLLSLAREIGLQVIGVCFHVGSGCKDPSIFEKAIRMAKKLFNTATLLGFQMNFLDIGGGFPGDKNTDILESSNVINAALVQHFPDPDVRVIAEPGRYFVSSAYTLITRVHSKREITRNGITDQIMYFINDGVYGSFINNVFEESCAGPKTSRDYVKTNDSVPPKFRSTIWGPTCDTIDLVCEDVMLPNMQLDDVMVFENMGAYTTPLASPFNGFPVPRVEYFMERGITSEIDSSALMEYLQR